MLDPPPFDPADEHSRIIDGVTGIVAGMTLLLLPCVAAASGHPIFNHLRIWMLAAGAFLFLLEILKMRHQLIKNLLRLISSQEQRLRDAAQREAVIAAWTGRYEAKLGASAEQEQEIAQERAKLREEFLQKAAGLSMLDAAWVAPHQGNWEAQEKLFLLAFPEASDSEIASAFGAVSALKGFAQRNWQSWRDPNGISEARKACPGFSDNHYEDALRRAYWAMSL